MVWIVLAALLFAIAALLIVTAVLEGAVPVEVDAVGTSLDTTVAGIFITGVVTTLLVLGGIAASLVGIQQMRARRKEIEYLRQRVAEQDRMVRPVSGAQADTAAQGDKSTPTDKAARGEQNEAETGGSARREKRRNDRSEADASAR